MSSFIFLGSINLYSDQLWVPKDNPALIEHSYSAMAQPVKVLDIKSEVNGKVDSYPVDFGQEIQKGQKIKIESKRVELSLSLIESELKALERSLASAKENVKLGKINKTFQEKEHKRAKALYEKGSLSEGELDRRQLELKSTEISSSRADLSESEILARLEMIRSQVALEKDLLDRHVIELPAGWVVSHKYVEQGSMAMVNQPLVQLADMSQFIFVYYLKPKEVIALRQQEWIELTFESLGNKKMKAQFVGVSPIPDPKTQKLKVELRVNNYNKGSLISGMIGKLVMKLADQNGFLQVHKNYVINEYEKMYLKDKSGQKHLIRVIRKSGDFFFISPKGLSEGPYVKIAGDHEEPH